MNIDIIVITKTWFSLKNRDVSAECHVHVCILLYTERINRKDGGVAMYVREKFILLRKKQYKGGRERHGVWLCILEEHDKLILGVIYRPPDLDNDHGKFLWDEIT